VALANLHFWLGLVGILLYVAAMWTSGVTQGVMLNATTEGGTVLAYPNFLDTLNTIKPMMLMRVIGGGLYLTGFVLLAYNLGRTIAGAAPVNGSIEVFVEEPPAAARLGGAGMALSAPVLFSVGALLSACLWLFGGGLFNLLGLFATIACVILAIAHYQVRSGRWGGWYDRLLVNSAPFTVLTFLAVAVGGLIQIIPTITVNTAANVEDRIQVPWTPLELAGRDLYVREGCYLCHSQMIRTLVPDVLRYGDYSRLGESIYDHPFQWGSKRTGPDLAREGGKYPHAWHYDHLMDPRQVSVGSIMPAYPWLFDDRADVGALQRKIDVLRTLGVPYPPWSAADIAAAAQAQARQITAELRVQQRLVEPDREIVALIAYLQKLGRSVPVPARMTAAQP
jgi:cytochrome c oxidase cbb3-type subunit I/II